MSVTRWEVKSCWAAVRMEGGTVKPPVDFRSESQVLMWVRPIWSLLGLSGVGVSEECSNARMARRRSKFGEGLVLVWVCREMDGRDLQMRLECPLRDSRFLEPRRSGL